jgi:hypothetical protein
VAPGLLAAAALRLAASFAEGALPPGAGKGSGVPPSPGGVSPAFRAQHPPHRMIIAIGLVQPG